MFDIRKLILLFTLLFAATTIWTSCIDDLSTSPIDDRELTSEEVYDDPENYREVLAKIYAGLAVTGQEGPAGDPDIDGIDEGMSDYLRSYWVHQELAADLAVNGWDDPGLPQFNFQGWGAGNDFVMGMYSRIFFQIPLANEFIRNAQNEEDQIILEYNAEARFLRALSYWHALDLFGGATPFVDEEDEIGAFEPEPISPEELFAFIESELLELADSEYMHDPQENEYGRADRAAVWTLLSKLYLNAETYIDEAMWDEAATFAAMVIDEGGYTLHDNYEELFMADNENADGLIFAIPYDGNNTQTWGGTTFLVNGSIGGSMDSGDFGVSEEWQGHRTTQQLADLFDDDAGIDNDDRALLHTDEQNRVVEDYGTFSDGYGVTKWKNITSEGESGSRSVHVDTDFPMFRLADVYLMYAEAAVRGGGDEGRALELVNDIRERANVDPVDAGDLDTDFILDERARELYWEGHRRTDLIRHGKFTGDDYVWAWKGNSMEGTSISDHKNVYPIPSADITANPQLEQNPGY